MEWAYRMVGKRVRVMANDISYNGTLIEISDETVELQGEYGWITIPMDRISYIEIDG